MVWWGVDSGEGVIKSRSGNNMVITIPRYR
jgi:hypothetical protein